MCFITTYFLYKVFWNSEDYWEDPLLRNKPREAAEIWIYRRGKIYYLFRTIFHNHIAKVTTCEEKGKKKEMQKEKGKKKEKNIKKMLQNGKSPRLNRRQN